MAIEVATDTLPTQCFYCNSHLPKEIDRVHYLLVPTLYEEVEEKAKVNFKIVAAHKVCHGMVRILKHDQESADALQKHLQSVTSEQTA